MAMLDLGLFICHCHQHLTQAFLGAHPRQEKRKQELDSRGGQCAELTLTSTAQVSPCQLDLLVSACASLMGVWDDQEHPTVNWCFRARAQVSELSGPSFSRGQLKRQGKKQDMWGVVFIIIT